MITADQALALSLDSDYNFQQLLQNIKQAAKNGHYNFHHQCYSVPMNGMTDKYVRGLKQLGFNAEKQEGTENIQISW